METTAARVHVKGTASAVPKEFVARSASTRTSVRPASAALGRVGGKRGKRVGKRVNGSA